MEYNKLKEQRQMDKLFICGTIGKFGRKTDIHIIQKCLQGIQ